MIAIGADHAGFELKEKIKKYFEEKAIAYYDFGAYELDPLDDAGDIAKVVSKAVNDGAYQKGILICGTGVMMSIVSNRNRLVRAVNTSDVETARMSRQHNDANILCIGARIISEEKSKEIIDVWLNEEFLGGKYAERVDKLKDLT